MQMRQWIQLLTMLGVCALQISSQSPEKPSFNGSWVLQSSGSSEFYTFEHDAVRLPLYQPKRSAISVQPSARTGFR
jgi:hypothetical protein